MVGPGSLYTSILPNLLVDGIAATLSGVTAPRVYVANLMTEPGETDGYSLSDHLGAIREHTGFDLFDFVLANRGAIPREAATAYAQDASYAVPLPDREAYICGARIIAGEFATTTAAGQIRHDPSALGFAHHLPRATPRRRWSRLSDSPGLNQDIAGSGGNPVLRPLTAPPPGSGAMESEQSRQKRNFETSRPVSE